MWPWKWRKVRTAKISKPDRDLFERYGEPVIGSILAGASCPTAPELQAIIPGNICLPPNTGKCTEARDWLTECRDAHERREQRLEFVEWAILLFILLEIALSILGLAQGHNQGTITPRVQAALLDPRDLATVSPAPAQKLAPPQPTEQQKLKERVDALESQLKEAQAKADRAAFEKDRIDKIQQHYEDYYEKVHTTEMHVLEATTAVFALFVGFAALFGFSVFDQRIQDAVSKATTDLETKLEKSNAARLKQLEDDLNQRIEKKVAKLENDTAVGLLYSSALTLIATKEYTRAGASIREALKVLANNPGGIPPETVQSMVTNLFHAIKFADPEKFHQEAKKELAANLYKKFENELNAAAIEIPELVPILKERREATPSTPKS